MVVPEASAIWRSSLNHRTHELRANLRANALQSLMDSGINPLWTYGLERIPDYLKPLSEGMLQVLQGNARRVTEQAYLELRNRQSRESQIAAHHENVTRTLFQELGRDDYSQAEERATGILSAYRAQEKKKLQAILARDNTKRPTSNEQWSTLLGGINRNQPEHTNNPPSTSRGPNPPSNGTSTGLNKKRRRSPSTSSQTRAQSERRNSSPTPGPSRAQNIRRTNSPAPGQSRPNYQGRNSNQPRFTSNRGNNSTRGRGRGRDHPTPQNPQEEAIIEALRVFLDKHKKN